MPFLKLASEKRRLSQGENVFTLFERLRSRSAFFMRNGKRYSFIGYDPFAKVWSREGVSHFLKLKDFSGWKKTTSAQMFEQKPLKVLRDLLNHFHFNGKSPVPFCGGLAGYFSYDFGTRLMGVEQKVFDDLELPDFKLFFVDKVLAVDHEKSELYFLALAPTESEAERKIEEMEKDLHSMPGIVSSGTIGKTVSNLTYEQYAQKIAEISRHLRDGDTYQVNFSQRFSADCSSDPWIIYKKLSEVNPAPYGCFFDFDEFQILSSSPELLLSKNGSKILTRPIKGTVPRGKNSYQERKNVQALLASEKDAAELAMIVDLERNDLGKVCDPGSVKVTAHREVEKYARVIHTVSTIEGKLLHSKDFFDAFEALFPGGSITGCPKKRTMEIIDELEDFKRGVYTGSAGFIGFDGNAVMNILIRTMIFQHNKLYFQAGGGIVIDSDPQKEYEEVFYKAEALNEALQKS